MISNRWRFCTQLLYCISFAVQGCWLKERHLLDFSTSPKSDCSTIENIVCTTNLFLLLATPLTGIAVLYTQTKPRKCCLQVSIRKNIVGLHFSKIVGIHCICCKYWATKAGRDKSKHNHIQNKVRHAVFVSGQPKVKLNRNFQSQFRNKLRKNRLGRNFSADLII